MPRTRVLDWTPPWSLGFVGGLTLLSPNKTSRFQAAPCQMPTVAMATLCWFFLHGDNRKITVKTVLFCVPPGIHLGLPTPLTCNNFFFIFKIILKSHFLLFALKSNSVAESLGPRALKSSPHPRAPAVHMLARHEPVRLGSLLLSEPQDQGAALPVYAPFPTRPHAGTTCGPDTSPVLQAGRLRLGFQAG